MQTNNNKIATRYSLCQLRQDISRQSQEEEKTPNAGIRDAKNKMKVIFYIISMTQIVDNNKDHEQDNVNNNELNNDESLFTFTFYVASRSQFDYSWNYLRSQWIDYETRLNEACTFILNMIDNVNRLLEHITEFSVDSFVFADLFVLKIDKEKGCPHMEIRWEALNNIFQLGKGYYISAKHGTGIIMTHYLAKNKNNDIDTFITQLTKKKD